MVPWGPAHNVCLSSAHSMCSACPQSLQLADDKLSGLASIMKAVHSRVRSWHAEPCEDHMTSNAAFN